MSCRVLAEREGQTVAGSTDKSSQTQASLFFFFFFFPETGFLCVTLTVLELTELTRLVLDSEICLPLPPGHWD